VSCFIDPQYIALWSPGTLSELIDRGYIDESKWRDFSKKKLANIALAPPVKHEPEIKIRTANHGKRNANLHDPVLRKELEAMILANVEIKAIVGAFDGAFTRSNVEYVRKRIGTPKKNGLPFTDIEKKMIEMRKRKVRPLQIAESLDISHEQVLRFVDRIKHYKRRGKKI